MTTKTDTELLPHIRQLQNLFGCEVVIQTPPHEIMSAEEHRRIVEAFDQAHYGGGWVYGGCVDDVPPCTPSRECYTK